MPMNNPLCGWSSCAITHTGKVRKSNEDSFLDRPDLGLWAVADGMGGHRAGDAASRMIVESLGQLETAASFGELVAAAEASLRSVNATLLAKGKEYHAPTGSTVVALLSDGSAGACLWAGDSRAYRWRDRGLTQLTRDHSQIEAYVRLGLIGRAEATLHPLSNVLTQAVGMQADLGLETLPLEPTAGDRYLLCSDGLYRHVTDQEIGDVLSAGPLSHAADTLLDLTMARGANDNVTIVLVEFCPGGATQDPDLGSDVTLPNLSFASKS